MAICHHLPWEVQGKLHIYRWPSAKSFSASSSMVASWWPTAFLSLGVPERVAAMWGFPRATVLMEVITVSPGVTLVASKFNLPTEVVTVNMHCLSPPAWSDGVWGLAILSTDLVVGTTQLSVLAGLVAQSVNRSFRVLMSTSANGTLVLSLGGVSAEPGRVSSVLASAGKVVGSTGGVSSLGVHLGDTRMVSTAPWVSTGLSSMPPTLAVVGRAAVPSYGISVSSLLASGAVSLRLWIKYLAC